MSAEPSRALSLSLKELVERYRNLVHAFGDPAALSVFGFSKAETESIFSAYDEDYHISRYFSFTETEGQRFIIDGVAATHVAISPDIESIL